MRSRRLAYRAGWLGLAVFVLGVGPATPQAPAPNQPRLEPVAETRLLMEGLNQANFRGMERLLQEQPKEVESWTFLRGQALLIAETGNLLMLRPPRNQGQNTWMTGAMEMRTAATQLARHTANQDYARSRAALFELAGTCNRCHQTFRVPTRIQPFAQQ